MTPHDYVVRCQLRRATKLLSRIDRSIIDIALDVGCAYQNHFTTMFRKCTGTTPGTFRLRAMANNSTATRVGRYGRPVRNARPPRFAMGTVANVAANQA